MLGIKVRGHAQQPYSPSTHQRNELVEELNLGYIGWGQTLKVSIYPLLKAVTLKFHSFALIPAQERLGHLGRVGQS